MTTTATLQRRRGLTLIELAWLVPVTALLVALRRPTQDNSYLWHIEAGLRQIDFGAVFTADPFTFTAGGQPWRTQSWLIELGYGWLEGIRPLASASVTVGIAAAVMMLAVGLLVAPARGIFGPIATLWVMWLALGYFTARPVFPSIALFAVLVLAVEYRCLRWVVPLVFWVWASIHGGFFIGLGYLLIQAFRKNDRSYAFDALMGVMAATFTAHGWGVWETLITFAGSSSNLDLISEWLAPDLVSLAHFPMLLGILGLLWLGAVGKLDRRDLWVVIPFLVFAFTANRSIPLAAIALVAVVFPVTYSRIGRTEFSWILSSLVVLLVLTLPLVVPIEEGLFEHRFPVEALSHMEPVRTFHDDSVGGYLIYRRFPEVFIDDRAELFGELFPAFAKTRSAVPGWDGLFEQYGLQQAVVRTEDPVRSVLELSGWRTVFEDERFVVLRPN